MGAKGRSTENRIMDTAEKLFAHKGYTAVTMKDISLAVPISRGGLYRHFPSTAAIFFAIIMREQDKAKASLDRARAGEVSPEKILNVYLRHRMSHILESDFGIDNAITEFASNSEEGRALAAKRAADSIEIIDGLITLGNQSGVYNCKDTKATARHICWIIEGMCKHCALIPISKEEADTQLSIILEMLK